MNQLHGDDRRHGTSAGYIAGCRGTCCRRAKSRYDKQRRLELLQTGEYRKTPSYRATRRLHALQALGWSIPAISKVAGVHHRHLYSLERHTTCYTSTFNAVDRAYSALSMMLPPEVTTGQRISAVRARKHAERNDWPPPLAWDDIDDPGEKPTSWRHDGIDRHADLDDMVANGFHLSEATRSLGMSVEALEKWCDRHGRREDFNRLMARERGVA